MPEIQSTIISIRFTTFSLFASGRYYCTIPEIDNVNFNNPIKLIDAKITSAFYDNSASKWQEGLDDNVLGIGLINGSSKVYFPYEIGTNSQILIPTRNHMQINQTITKINFDWLSGYILTSPGAGDIYLVNLNLNFIELPNEKTNI